MGSSSLPVSGGPQTMLTCAELAARWGVDIKSVYEGIKLRQIPVVRIGRRIIRIALAVIERIEQGGRVEPHGGTHGRST